MSIWRRPKFASGAPRVLVCPTSDPPAVAVPAHSVRKLRNPNRFIKFASRRSNHSVKTKRRADIHTDPTFETELIAVIQQVLNDFLLLTRIRRRAPLFSGTPLPLLPANRLAPVIYTFRQPRVRPAELQTRGLSLGKRPTVWTLRR
ncbi:hypothetical protein KCP69_25620 [Salmonella enterica subsp. enterica]|nr:hypothetical protein KCP69_25620 [Salmonella enterica subsp. enterica]